MFCQFTNAVKSVIIKNVTRTVLYRKCYTKIISGGDELDKFYIVEIENDFVW